MIVGNSRANHNHVIKKSPKDEEMSNLQQQDQRKAIIEQDKLNRQTPFDPQKQLYPADLFVLVGFDGKAQPIWERNPR